MIALRGQRVEPVEDVAEVGPDFRLALIVLSNSFLITAIVRLLCFRAFGLDLGSARRAARASLRAASFSLDHRGVCPRMSAVSARDQCHTAQSLASGAWDRV